MKPSPYSIYVNKRHIKIAFLVSKSSSNVKKIFELIFDYNFNRWGGRFNPILFTNHGKIDEKEWELLLNYDPDFIKTFSGVNKVYLEKIDNFLSPIFIKNGSSRIDPYVDPASIVPSLKNIKKIPYRSEDNKLALFKFTKATPDYIKKFIKYNFGIIEPYYVNTRLDDSNKKIYKISKIADLVEFLDEAGEYRSNIVFPLQLSSIDAVMTAPEHDYKYEKFEVIVGDSIENLVYHWNRNFFVQPWLRPELTSIWLPEKLAKNKDLSEALSKFINKYGNRTGNDSGRGINFSSFNVHSNSLNSIKKNLTVKVHLPSWSIKLKEFQVPNYKAYPYHITTKAGMDFIRAQGEDEQILLSEPEVEQGTMAGQHWIADLHIQFRPERFTNYIGKEFWWQLPNRNVLAHQMVKNKPSRITKRGFLSVVMRRSTDFIAERENENLLSIKLLSDEDIIRLLFFQRFSPYFNGDLRKAKKIQERSYLRVGVSSNGKNLNGLISLFGGLSSSYNIFDSRYWRNMFDAFSKKEKIFNDTQVEIIKNKFEKPNGVKRAIKHVVGLVEGVLNNERAFPYSYFKKEAKKELDDFNTKQNPKFKFDENELKRAIQYLVEKQVLIMGISPNCPICGTKNWYQADKIKKDLICEGCNNSFSLGVEEGWSYKLNSLVKNCHSFQGLAPVIIVLGELLSFCRSCFMYTVSLDVYKGRNKRPITDVDIVCIRDGEFIIGEIKESLSGFDDKDFDKMKNIAKIIRPDRVIFSSLDRRPNQTIQQKIEFLRKDLEHLGIKVDYYSILVNSVQPSPHFV